MDSLPVSTNTDMPIQAMQATQAIGIFDSGIGGLSVLQHIRAQLPHENLIYFADSGFAPYGNKPEQLVIGRSLNITDFLLKANCKVLVVACNTATASAVHILRERCPALPIVGIEPGLKPATTITRSGMVGVLATERTLASKKFHLLSEQLSENTGVRFVAQACQGLADLIEQGDLHSEKTRALVEQYTAPLIEQNVDTIVLGCTHYPFIRDTLEQLAKEAGIDHLHIIDTGLAVTRQLIRTLDNTGLRHNAQKTEKGNLTAYTTGDAEILADQFYQLLGITPPIHKVLL